ncbi:hypothetical protein Ntsu_75790 [Nocardia sp. IFM 10818]
MKHFLRSSSVPPDALVPAREQSTTAGPRTGPCPPLKAPIHPTAPELFGGVLEPPAVLSVSPYVGVVRAAPESVGGCSNR